MPRHCTALARTISALTVGALLSGCAGMREKIADWKKPKPGESEEAIAADDFNRKDQKDFAAKFYTDLGNIQVQAKSYSRALEMYNRAIAEHKKFAPAYCGMAKTYIAMNELDRAAETLKRGQKHCPKSHEVYNEMAVVCGMQEKYSEGIAHAQKALQLRGTEPTYQMNLANLFAASGQYDRAYDEYLKACSASEAHYRIAGVQHSRGDSTASLDTLRKSLAADPRNERAARMIEILAAEYEPEIATVSHQEPQASRPPVQQPVNRAGYRIAEQ